MPGVQLSKSVSAIPDRPEVYGDSLAHVLHREADKLIPLGQAWIAGPGQLVTCGHVVEKYLSKPAEIIVKFPASGNTYEIRQVKIHPSFSRQDELLKYDAALISIDPIAPESLAPVLPVIFDKTVKTQQTLYAVRYPIHLGSLSAAPNPLVQEGRLLGPLRRGDNLHLLHDLPLSPGDSGAPLFDQSGVVAMHCGDTASLPGLNLPTTSIRMALSTDALRELGVHGVTPADAQANAAKKIFTLNTIAIFLVSACLSMALVMGGIYVCKGNGQYWRPDNRAIAPLAISFSTATAGAGANQQIQLLPGSPCHVYVVFAGENQISLLYPPQSALEQKASSDPISIDLPKDFSVLEEADQGRLLVVAVNADYRLVKTEDVIVREHTALPLVDNRDQFFAHLDQLLAGGNAISQQVFPPPANAAVKVTDSQAPSTIEPSATEPKPTAATQTPVAGPAPSATQTGATDAKAPGSPETPPDSLTPATTQATTVDGKQPSPQPQTPAANKSPPLP
jgi:Trypsin-like peptidase domain